MAPLFPAKYRRYWPAAVTLAAGLILTAAIGWELHREAEVMDRKRFALRIEEVMDQLDGRVEKTEQLLQQLQDFLSFSRGDRQELFREWSRRRGLSYNYPWVCGILVATNTQPLAWHGRVPTPGGRSSTNWADFEKFSTNLALECRVALTTSARRGMRYLDDYDLRGSRQQTNGFNGFSKAAWSAGLRISRQQAVMRDTEGRSVPGILFLMPVHNAGVTDVLQHVRGDDGVRVRAVRWMHLAAMIVAPVDFQPLERALWDGKESDLGLEIFSTLKPATETWLNSTGPQPKAIDPKFQGRAYLTATNKWSMYADRFSIYFHTTPLFEAQSSRRLARTASTAGLGFTLLATALVAVIPRARGRQEQMAADVIEARDALAAAGRERVRLGHDLHDGAIQSLYAIQLGLTRTATEVETSLPASARVLGETRERVDEVIAELRRFILAREADALRSEPGGLERVLAAMNQRLQPTTGTELQFHAEPGASERLSLAQTVQLTQIARSALANSLRHAQARQVKIVLRQSTQSVGLEITDDGVGFDPSLTGNGGMGLRTMQARATEAGGALTIEARCGGGTRIVVQVSVAKVETPEDEES